MRRFPFILSSSKGLPPHFAASRYPERQTAEQLMEIAPDDPYWTAQPWVARVRRQARRLARWQLLAELAIVAAAIGLVLVPAIITALRAWLAS